MIKVLRILIVFLLLIFQAEASKAQVFQDSLRKFERSQLINAAKKQVAKKTAESADFWKDGSYINLVAHNGKFISFDQNGSVRGSASKAQAWERIRVVRVDANRVALFGVHGNYASARLDADGTPLSVANRPLDWETFELVANGGDSYSLKGANGKFLGVEPNGDIFVRADKINTWEKLKVQPADQAEFPKLLTGTIVGFMLESASKYFSIQQDKDFEILADSSEARTWERFRLVSSDGLNFSFQADNGFWLAVDAKDKNSRLCIEEITNGNPQVFQIFSGEGEKIFLKAVNGMFVRIVNGQPRADSDTPIAMRLKILPAEDEISFTPIFSKGGLRCGYLNEFNREWSSRDLGVAMDISIHRPKVPKGWAFLGDSLAVGEDKPAYSTMIILDNPGSGDLKKPVAYEEVWNDKDAKKNCQHLSIWRPVPPEGYVALGFVATKDYKDPARVSSLNSLRCVRKDHVAPGRASRPVWNDKGSGAKNPLSLFAIGRNEGDISSLPPGTFLAGFYNDSPVGGSGGDNYSELAPDSDWYLAGLKGRSGSLIDAITPVYRRFSDVKEEKQGNERGGGGGGSFSMIAREGYAVAGISGRSGSQIDGFKIQFMKLNGRSLDLKDKYESSATGGSGGGDFVLGGKGCVFQGVDIRSGGLIDALNLVPMPMSEAWVITAKSPDELRTEVVKGITDLYLETNRNTINEESRQAFLKQNPGIAESETGQPGSDSSATSFVMPATPDLQVAEAGNADESMSDASTVDNGKTSKGSSDPAKTLKEEFDKIAGSVGNASKDMFALIEKVFDFLGFENPRFKLENETLILLADLRLSLSDSLKLNLDLAVDIPLIDTKTKGVLVRSEIPGEWKNPLGINGLTLKKIGFGGNIGFNDKKPGKIDPTLFLKGAMDIGLSGPVEMLGAYDPAMPGFAGLKGQLAEISWDEITKVANFFYRIATRNSNSVLPQPDFPLDLIKIRKAEFMAAKKTVPNLDLVLGTRLRGDFIISGNEVGNVEVLFAPEGNTTAIAMMKQQEIGPISLSAPFGSKNSHGGPICVIEHKKSGNSCSIRGRVEVAGSALDYLQELGKSSVVKLSGNLAGVLPVTLQGVCDFNDKGFLPSQKMDLSGSVDSSFLTTIQGKVISSVQSVPGFGDLVANFNKSLVSIDAINIKASLESLKSARLPELTVKFRIFGKANDISLKNVGLSGTFVSDIVKKVADEVVKQAGNLAAQFAKAMAEVIGKYTGQIAEEAGKVADEVVQAAEQSAKVVTEAVSSITNFSRDAGKKIVDFGQSALSGAGSVAGAIGSGIKKLKFW